MSNSLNYRSFLRPLGASLLIAALGGVVACKSMPVDPSMSAAEAGDYVLGTSACGAVPGGGMDACFVREGTKIDSDWVLIVPAGFSAITSGEINVYYRDLVKSYPVTGKVIRIPWADFFQSAVWRREFDGEALALVTIGYRDNGGVERTQQFRGLAKLVVLKEGYDKIPIDSGYAAFKTVCRIQYSSAGRGAISCK